MKCSWQQAAGRELEEAARQSGNWAGRGEVGPDFSGQGQPEDSEQWAAGSWQEEEG